MAERQTARCCSRFGISAEFALLSLYEPYRDPGVTINPRDVRPLLQHMTAEIRAAFEEGRRDVSALLQIREELTHRRRKAARNLLDEVSVQLDALFPTTVAPKGTGKLPAPDWPKVSPLKLMGYTVGRSGESVFRREDILRRAFLGPIPNTFDSEYMAEWGQPRTTERLLKMANGIATFCRNQKREDEVKMAQAIRDWEHDLAWLKRTFYDGQFRFAWPATSSTPSASRRRR